MNKMVKNGNVYKIISISSDGQISIIAKLEKAKNGYTKIIYSETTKIWFIPKYFSFFPTLKAAKSFYDIK